MIKIRKVFVDLMRDANRNASSGSVIQDGPHRGWRVPEVSGSWVYVGGALYESHDSNVLAREFAAAINRIGGYAGAMSNDEVFLYYVWRPSVTGGLPLSVKAAFDEDVEFFDNIVAGLYANNRSALTRWAVKCAELSAAASSAFDDQSTKIAGAINECLSVLHESPENSRAIRYKVAHLASGPDGKYTSVCASLQSSLYAIDVATAARELAAIEYATLLVRSRDEAFRDECLLQLDAIK